MKRRTFFRVTAGAFICTALNLPRLAAPIPAMSLARPEFAPSESYSHWNQPFKGQDRARLIASIKPRSAFAFTTGGERYVPIRT